MLSPRKGMPVMPENKSMTEMEFTIVMTVPSRMTAEEVARDLRTCISFGRPFITNASRAGNFQRPQPA